MDEDRHKKERATQGHNVTDKHAGEKERERKPAVRKRGQLVHLFDIAGQYIMS